MARQTSSPQLVVNDRPSVGQAIGDFRPILVHRSHDPVLDDRQEPPLAVDPDGDVQTGVTGLLAKT